MNSLYCVDMGRGTWCRVCETCYKTREGYNDTEGISSPGS